MGKDIYMYNYMKLTDTFSFQNSVLLNSNMFGYITICKWRVREKGAFTTF